MLELDFAFFNMMNSNRQGLAKQKFLLDRLAPLFYGPRVERLIDLSELGFKGLNIHMPLGEGNWQNLQEDRQRLLLRRSEEILGEYELEWMAVDRRLKRVFTSAPGKLCRFGDHFILALAVTLIERTISRHAIDRLILAGDIPYLVPLIENLSQYQIPISVQNYYPVRCELIIHRLMYEKGLAISNSAISPQNWGKGDLVIFFDAHCQRFTVGRPQAFYINLEDNRRCLAPDLENQLSKAGLESGLYTLAPIMESCIAAQAGIAAMGREEDRAACPETAFDFEDIVAAGRVMDLWFYFADTLLCLLLYP